MWQNGKYGKKSVKCWKKVQKGWKQVKMGEKGEKSLKRVTKGWIKGKIIGKKDEIRWKKEKKGGKG